MGKLERTIIETGTQETSQQKRFELVERKGIGHPDYLADAIAERFSRLLCKEYLQRCGQVLHHNVDKLIITAGETKTMFGGGRFERPVLVFFSGRATSSIGNRFFDVNKIARKSAVEVIEETFSGTMREQCQMHPTWNPRDRHEMVPLVKTRGGKLLFQKSLLSFPPLANDSSCGSGYAPLSWSERLVYEAERFLNSAEFKKKHPSSGTDIKITGTRTGKMLSMTIAMAFVDRFVAGVREYIEQKARIIEELREHIVDHLPSSGESIERIDLNPFDNERVALKNERENGNAEEHLYLTVTGSSIEHSDDGTVGRGNKANGISPFNRPLTIGSIAGKNPISHPGKLYTLLAFLIAREIYSETKEDGTAEVYVSLATEIGRKITNPKLTHIKLVSKRKARIKRNVIEEIVQSLVTTELCSEVAPKQCKLSQDIIQGKYVMF